VRWRLPSGAAKARTFKRRRDADDFAVRVEHELRSRSYVDPDKGRMLVEDWVGEMMAGRLNLRPSTLARDWSYLRSLIEPSLTRGFSLWALVGSNH
jgi:hypothetical protein